MKHLPFLVRILLILLSFVFTAKWLNVSFTSMFVHIWFAAMCCCIYIAFSWVHLAVQKLYFNHFSKKNHDPEE